MGHYPTVDSNVATLPYRSDGRRQTRTHLFVAASLLCERTTFPVRLRNMSNTGALIECTVEGPSAGQRVLLRRGTLEVAGTVAWSEGKRAGLAFDTIVEVGQWMARVGSAGQSRIDEIVADIRSGPTPSAETASPRPQSDLVGQLKDVRDQISRLADSLLEDEDVAMRHPEIQIFDITLQKLDRLIKEQTA